MGWVNGHEGRTWGCPGGLAERRRVHEIVQVELRAVMHPPSCGILARRIGARIAHARGAAHRQFRNTRDYAPVTDSYTNPRRFIRHTADVPLEIRAVPGSAPVVQQGTNVSEGGLAFVADACLDPEETIEIRIPEVDPPFEAHGRVVWCRPEDDGRYLVGVQFLDATDTFRARMVEQVCTIEKYRKDVQEQEGRELDPQEAAAEWIQKYAGRFPTA